MNELLKCCYVCFVCWFLVCCAYVREHCLVFALIGEEPGDRVPAERSQKDAQLGVASRL